MIQNALSSFMALLNMVACSLVTNGWPRTNRVNLLLSLLTSASVRWVSVMAAPTHAPRHWTKHSMSKESRGFTAISLSFASIALLFAARGPFAVVWRVATIVVDSFNRQSGRPGANVAQELIEVTPSIADGNAPTTVVLKRFVCGVKASIEHVLPGSIFRRVSGSNWCNAESFLAAADQLYATATLCVSALQRVRWHISRVPALASAQPHDVALESCFGGRQWREFSELESGDVLARCPERDSGYSVLSHAVSSFTGAVSVRGLGSLSTVPSLDNYLTLGPSI